MADTTKILKAKEVFATLCTTLDKENWRYNKDEEKLVVYLTVRGKDIPIYIIAQVDVDRQLIKILSPMNFNICQEKRLEGAIATCAATYALVDGSFDYNLNTGLIAFRINAAFMESSIGEGLIKYLVYLTCGAVYKYNDKFLALDKGNINIDEFISNL